MNKITSKCTQCMDSIKAWIQEPRNIACAKGFSIFSFLSYFYFVANNLDNIDTVSNAPYGYGSGVNLGRWFLQFLGETLRKFDLDYCVPFFNVLIALVFLCLSTLLCIRILRIQNLRLCFCFGAISASFPVVAATMFFSFTVQYYFFAVLLSTIGVYLAEKKKWYRFLSALFFSLSLGIYQAYFPFIASLFILVLIRDTLDNDLKWSTVVFDALFYLAMMFCGYILYRIFWNFSLDYYNVSPDLYQGVASMGKLPTEQLPRIIGAAYRNFTSFRKNYCSIGTTRIIRICINFCSAFSLAMFALQWKTRPIIKNLELAFLLLLLPIAANSIEIMAPSGEIYTVMVFGMIAIFYLPILLAENFSISCKNSKIAALLLCPLILIPAVDYAYCTNVNYRALYYQNRQIENYYTAMFSEIRSMDQYDQDMKIVFMSNHNSDSSLTMDPWACLDVEYGGRASNSTDALSPYPASRVHFIGNYLGYETQYASEEEAIKYAPYFAESETYPNGGSIKIIDNTVFVNLG